MQNAAMPVIARTAAIIRAATPADAAALARIYNYYITNTVITFKGIFLQKQRSGGGFHLGPDESSAVRVGP